MTAKISSPIILAVSLVSCGKNNDLDSTLLEKITAYQQKVQLPTKDWARKHSPHFQPKYFYSVSFWKDGRDTAFSVTMQDGFFGNFENTYGIYGEKDRPIIITDREDVAGKFIIKKKIAGLKNFYIKNPGINDAFFRADFYKVAHGKIVFQHTVFGNMEDQLAK